MAPPSQPEQQQILCPTCRLSPSTPPSCRRCGTDLTSLMRAAQAAQKLAAASYAAFAAGDGRAARALATQARGVHDSPSSRLSHAIARLLPSVE